MTANNMSYKHKGGPVGVLLVHGLCGTPAEMRFVANTLARSGHTVFCPQLAGHGGSDDAVRETTFEEWYRSVEEALIEMRETCSTVIVGGLSTGAVLALLLAARHPDKVQGLTLFAPTLWLDGWSVPWYARLFKLVGFKALANLFTFPDREPHGIKDDRIRDFFAKLLFAGEGNSAGIPCTPGGAVLEHRWLVDAVKPLLGQIEQPALIIHPREDDLAGLSNTAHLQRKLAGIVDTVVLNDCYHNLTIDRQRHIVAERTRAWVARIAEEIGAAERPTATVTPLKVAA
jgi:carboxylesterase